MGAAVADDGFDFTPGAQVPLTGAAGQTAATFALASAAYRDSEVAEILKADNEWHKSDGQERPQVGDDLPAQPGRGVLPRRAGTACSARAASRSSSPSASEPQVVVEHCLAANRIRKERDNWLTAVMVLCGLLFLPGLLLWLLVFQLRRDDRRARRTSAPAPSAPCCWSAVGALAVIFLIQMPFTGFWAWYARACSSLPVVGWFWAKQICERTAKDLRERWERSAGGRRHRRQDPRGRARQPRRDRAPSSCARAWPGSAPSSSPTSSSTRAPRAYSAWAPAGAAGSSPRSWCPPTPSKEIHPFRSWDVIRAIHDQLRMLERGPLHTGGFPTPSITALGGHARSARAPRRWPGRRARTWRRTRSRTTRYRDLQQAAVRQRQPALPGRAVDALGRPVGHHDADHRDRAAPHAAHRGDRARAGARCIGLFTTKPEAKDEGGPASRVRFWETRKVKLPLVDTDEVVRLAARAPLTWYPPLLDWLGGQAGAARAVRAAARLG